MSVCDPKFGLKCESVENTVRVFKFEASTQRLLVRLNGRVDRGVRGCAAFGGGYKDDVSDG